MKKYKKKVVGIIAEYNPFHNGHIYQINWIKKHIPNAYIIVAMSNKYTQRGEITCASYYQRKKIAKAYGVNKVIKLNDKDVIQAAHIFAQAGVNLLNKHKIDYLVFGSETNNVELFVKIARTIKENNELYHKLIRQYMKKGANSFPKASNLAIKELLNEDIQMPNDILGLEYIKTIIDNDFNITPISIQRTIAFHSNDVLDEFASATKLREMLKQNQDISQYSPMKIKYNKKRDIAYTYAKFASYVKRTTAKKIAQFKLIDEGIENLFKKQVLLNNNYVDFIEACVSKRYTRSRIQRCYLNVLLRIKK
ncbi:nucleotidyltransferase [Mycoplasmopsis verecunda]|uniref:Cytidyltransferase-like domain-containing protein n=1 Tax=Mycoplasmopsis verecunda TaxID=171291 RepID=A0A1T4KRG2_9BACT|nr:nucleotidyltransferase [Mycoplasmopsis verecunda]WPB54687.1 nucleotidyltransferase [Mycoplasmopsis verecunda]SJZ45014.1 cytidyltransferase-like domain-containing protein [Mycoplasmopsis verecunda]